MFLRHLHVNINKLKKILSPLYFIQDFYICILSEMFQFVKSLTSMVGINIIMEAEAHCSSKIGKYAA